MEENLLNKFSRLHLIAAARRLGVDVKHNITAVNVKLKLIPFPFKRLKEVLNEVVAE